MDTLTYFSVGLPRTVCSFVCDFIALEIMESNMARLSSQYSNKFNIQYIHYISLSYFLFPLCIF